MLRTAYISGEFYGHNRDNRQNLEVVIMLKLVKGYDSINKTFRIPVSVADELDRLAGVYNTSVNKVVVQCLQYALKDIVIEETTEEVNEEQK